MDFEKTVEIFSKNPKLVDNLSKLVANVVEVSGIEDIKRAFEMDIQKAYGKTIMKWR